MVAAALGIGAAVAGVGGALISSNAASGAAETQAAAANNGTAATQAQQAQTRADLSPFTQGGYGGLGALLATLGLTPATQGGFVTTPAPQASGDASGGLPNGWSIVPGDGGGNPLSDGG